MVPDYRVKFFYLLRDALKYEGIDFALVAGSVREGEALHDAYPIEDWAHRSKNVYFTNAIYYQNASRYFSNADLVIVHEGGGALINYQLLLKKVLLRAPNVAFFGHGANLNIKTKRVIRDTIKSYMERLPDWWFAYTDASMKLLRKSGYPECKITVVNNSIDTRGFVESINNIGQASIDEIMNALGIAKNDIVGIFCGRLSKIKVGFLIDAAKLIRKRVAKYQLVIIGRGEVENDIKQFCATSGWAHYVGPKFGAERLPYFRMASHFLMPGQVGLGILDAFAAGLPFFTTDCGIHSPEIAYLKNGVNGYMTNDDLTEYARTVSDCIENPVLLENMSREARTTANGINLETMANNFVLGIKRILY